MKINVNEEMKKRTYIELLNILKMNYIHNTKINNK